MPDASPRSVVAAAAGLPASRQVSQSCGSSTASVRAALAGSCSASQRSLVTVKEAVGTLPGPLRPALRTAQLSDQLSGRRRGPQVVPEQRGPDHLTVPVEHDHAVLLAGHADGCGLLPGEAPAWASAAHQAAGSASVPGGCGALPRPITVPSAASHSRTFTDCVEESTPATSMLHLSRDPPMAG